MINNAEVGGPASSSIKIYDDERKPANHAPTSTEGAASVGSDSALNPMRNTNSPSTQK